MLKFVFLKTFIGKGIIDAEVYTTLHQLLISIDPVRADFNYTKAGELFRRNLPFVCGNYIIIKTKLIHNRNGKSKRTN